MNSEDTSNLVLWASEIILQVLGLFPKNKREQTKDQEEVLIALMGAYNSTKAYYTYRGHSPRNTDREWNVADKWDRVSILMKKYDQTLANRLSLKGRYWKEGANWTNDAIRDARIGLEDIHREISVRIEPT